MRRPRNAFQQTMATLAFRPDPERPADIFSRTCVTAWEELDLEHGSYQLSQVFEPAVLAEVALYEGTTPPDELADLSYARTSPIGRLAELVAESDELNLRGLVNLAAVLVSLSRFAIAVGVADRAERRSRTAQDRFEVAWLRFMISNRCARDADSPAAFAAMRAAITEGGLAPDRILDACTQAAVWHNKRRAVSDSDHRWFLATGARLIASGRVASAATESAWYRGIAMIPAARGDAAATRRMMTRARLAADRLAAEAPGAYSDNFLKTYYESTLKEHLYVTRDFDAALAAGAALVELDPYWGPSHAEVAEVYERMGALAEAARWYEQAAACGLPYVGHHLLRAARCRERAGDYAAACVIYTDLARVTPMNQRVLERGREWAKYAPSAIAQEFASVVANGTEG